MQPAALLSVLFLCFVALGHLWRIVLGLEIVGDGVVLPMWPSVLVVLGPGALAVWLLREQQRPTRA